MKTQEYLTTVAPRQSYMQVQLPRSERISRWVFDHSKGIQNSEVIGAVFGIAAIATLPLTLPILGGGAIAIAVIGAMMVVAALVSHTISRVIFPHAHDISKHTFTPGECRGGKLFYYQDTPILDLSGDPYTQGKAQGILMHKAMGRMLPRWIVGLRASGWPKAEKIPEQIEEIAKTIPERILQEMRGVVDGYNSKRRWYHPKLSLNALILMNMIPDQTHFTPQKAGKFRSEVLHRLQHLRQVACTTIIGRDQEEGVVLGRNMDWQSLGIMGEVVYLKKTRYGNKTIVEVSAPGLMGTVTGMNSEGLSLSMNVNPSQYKKMGGMPSAILNRLILENCNTVEEVMTYIETHHPMGSFHLSVADKKGAKRISFYQGQWIDREGEVPSGLVRILGDEEPVITTNAVYDGETISADMWYSRLRERGLNAFFKDTREKIDPQDYRISQLIPWALQYIPQVNNSETNYFAMMKPQDLSLDLRVSHTFGASARNAHIPKQVLFS